MIQPLSKRFFSYFIRNRTLESYKMRNRTHDMKHFKFSFIRALALILVATSYPNLAWGLNPPTPCGSIMCLGGLIIGGSGGPDCYSATQTYFALFVPLPIPPFYNPVATAQIRANYLLACVEIPAPINHAWIPAITATYGWMPPFTPPPFPPPLTP